MFRRIYRCLSEIVQLLMGWLPVFGQMIYGLVKLSRIPQPRVTFFGGSRFDQHQLYTQMAQDLASKLAAHDISVLTGGGAGIMQAANCGVSLSQATKRARTMGIMVADLGDETVNACTQEQIVLKYFFARKWLLTHYVRAFVVFPGGFGTLDELMEVLTLIKTKQMAQVPVILIGVSYWQDFLDWLKQVPLRDRTITQNDLDLILLTDSLDLVLSRIVAYCCPKLN